MTASVSWFSDADFTLRARSPPPVCVSQGRDPEATDSSGSVGGVRSVPPRAQLQVLLGGVGTRLDTTSLGLRVPILGMYGAAYT